MEQVVYPNLTEGLVITDQKRRRLDPSGPTEEPTFGPNIEPNSFIDLNGPVTSPNKLHPIRNKLGYLGLFYVKNEGHSGGLALFWKDGTEVTIRSYSKHHIDAIVSLNAGDSIWRFTGFYGAPDRHERQQSWSLLKRLATSSTLPWVVMGDFNDVLHPEEKRGGNPQPMRLIRGFREAVETSGLKDYAFDGYQFTWERSKGTPTWIEAKLDRILVTDSWCEMFTSAKACSVTTPKSDHMPLHLQILPPPIHNPSIRYRFENLWLREAHCREVMIDSWSKSHGQDLMNRVGRCGKAIWIWGKNFARDFQRRLDFWRRRMESTKHRRDQLGISQFSEAQAQYLRVLQQQSDYWRQRAKQFWLKDGDTNSSFFHKSVRRRQQANRITKLKDSNGNWVEGGTALDSLITSYFHDLFCSSLDIMNAAADCIVPLINASHNASLSRTVTFQEVKDALFDMKPDKSPGPDGLNPGFFQHFWDIIGSELHHFCSDFFRTGKLPVSLNSTYIVLIPKKTKPDSMGDLRPIALCNTLYKLLSKVLANRIKPLLANIISESQSAFVPGRLISDNIMLAFELNHYLKRKSQGNTGYVGVKLDMSKAFDRVNWYFLLKVMEKMGFSSHFVNLIREMISTVRYTILLEGRAIGTVIPNRGLRQGDPMSPYLFILILESLHLLIQKSQTSGLLHGISIARRAPTITNLFFADDCYIFCKATPSEAAALKNILETFTSASGQSVNYTKSTLSFSRNTCTNSKTAFCNIMGIREGNLNGSYLGLPSIIGRNKREILGFIKDKVVGRIKSWTHKFLSRAGKEILLKNVIQAIPTFAMSVFLLPIEMGKDIERTMNSFWWGCTGDRNKGIRWKSWERLSIPKKWGGMGFKRIREFNIAMLGKQAWRLVQQPNSLLSRVYRAKYYPNSSFFDAQLGSNPSFIWRSILEAQHTLKMGCRWRIGDGNSVNIWTDPWLPNSEFPFILTSMPDHPLVTSVASLINAVDHSWNATLIGSTFSQVDRDLILSIPLPNSPTNDKIIWMHDEKGKFTVRSCYKHILGNMDHLQPPFWTRAWKLNLPPKIKSFLWQLCSSSLPTCDNLRSRHVQIPDSCQICNVVGETDFHLFVICPLARNCWDILGGVDYHSDNTFFDWLERIFSSKSDADICLIISICWKLWEARNEKLWNHTILNASFICLSVKNFIFEWPKVNAYTVSNTRSTDSLTSWTRPPHGMLKLNVDAALDSANKRMGFGFILRDHTGALVAARRLPWFSLHKPNEAEAIAVREALKWIRGTNIDNVLLETDCLQVVNSISVSHAFNSSFDLLVNDVRSIAAVFSNLGFLFAKRSANRVAHTLAREALSMPDCSDCSFVPFPSIAPFFSMDLA
ncbi:PREDICTED: uncharacterized protein LOC109167502 [Ipomoea nil]|uniref:uncharacterized protein LOC109167502 n=1 Tax=Ipomoea nil TaxID=35883 RepID=UPI000901E3B4|nr:PREDICTED: uncharacterized protein LOC109167502 [Ipomoea nil]